MYNVRRAGSPILATIVLIVAGIIIAGAVFAWNMVGSSDTPLYKMEISAVYQVKPVSVENAGWQIAVTIDNQGNRESIVDRIFINERLVEEMGIIHGGCLSSTSSVGTSIPEEGLIISAKKGATLYIWIGSNLYSPGSYVNINVQQLNQLELKRTIKLS